MAQDDSPSMGCMVPHEVCPDCKPCDHTKPELVDDTKFHSISVITFTPKDIRQVAEHAGVTEERARQYLGTDGDQDNDLLKAYHWITGCYPIGKFPT